MNPKVALIGGLSIVLLTFFQFYKRPFLKFLPPPLIVVVLGILLGNYFEVGVMGFYEMWGTDHILGEHYLVALPEDFLFFPDFSKITQFDFWSVVMTVTIIQGIESLLSASAVEQLDPYKRHCDLNKDLKAVGIGSMVGGSLGGIPIIAEIVRSSANITNGAVSRWSNFFHGTFILLGTLLIPTIINQIPLAALAGILVMVGFRLASPKEFVHTYEIGKEQLAIFVVTIVAVLATDLLSGIIIGIVLKMLISLFLGAKIQNVFKPNFVIENLENGNIKVNLSGSYTFTNFIPLKGKLASLPKEKEIHFDWSGVSYFDHTSYDRFKAWQGEYNMEDGTCFNENDGHLNPLSKFETAGRTSKKFFKK
jgi:MFS superfamily sulfate permease-like transporter